MKKLVTILLLFVYTFSLSQQITISVTLSGTPNDTTKLIPANLKYNKWGRLGLTVDDQQKTALDLAAYMTGGTAHANGVTYSGKTFTDGANTRAKNIPYRGTVAANAFWATDTLQSSWNLTSGNMTISEMQGLINAGWDLADHGAFHELDYTGPTNLGLNALKNAALNRNYEFRQFGYITRVGVVPTAWAGYQSAWEQLGYIGGSSESIDDGYPYTKPGWDNFGLVNVTNWKNDNRYKVLLRRFKDISDVAPYGDRVSFLDAMNALVNQVTATTNLEVEHGMHNVAMDAMMYCIDSLYSHANNKIWVCGMQEFLEYFETIQQSQIKQTISGNTLTITIDQSFLPEATRWRDMSFLLSSNVNISSVTVTGADDYSYNTSTGLINIYKKKTTGFSTPPYYNATGFVFGQKINLQKDDIFIDNNVQPYYDPGLGMMVDYGMLVDGDTTKQYSAAASGSLIYSPYEVNVDLSDYGAAVTKVRIKGAGSGFSTDVILKRNDNEADSLIGTYTGGTGWTEINKTGNNFVASRLIFRSNSVAGFGTEIEVYADHQPYTEQVYPHRKTPLGYMLGVNSFAWDFIDNNATSLTAGKLSAFNSLGLRSLRNYADVPFYSRDNGATYSFDPISTAHHEDKVFRQLKVDNPKLIRWSVMQGQSEQVRQDWRNNPDESYKIVGTVTSYVDNTSYGVLTLNVTSTAGAGSQPADWRFDNLTRTAPVQYAEKTPVTIPTSLPATVVFYIGGGVSSFYQVGDNVSAKLVYTSVLNLMYANNTISGRSTLNAWDSVARLGYVYAARRGKNANATKHIPFSSVSEPWLNNNDSVGLNTSERVEVMNEPNASWLGYNNYVNGKGLAYAWSKTFDNNKTYSTKFGVKNADTSMSVSTSGLAINTVDLNRAAEVTARQLRGNRPKANVPVQPNYWKAKTYGWTDNPFDVIQFHNYSYTGGANQYGAGVNSGIPIEISPALQGVKDFVWFRNKYAPWAKVDVGEWGFDLHQSSPMNAPAIGSHSIDEVRGAWSIRTMLMYNVLGVDDAQFYRLFSYDSTSIQFSTMSLLRDNGDGTFSRRLVGNYFAQLSKFGDYYFDSTLRDDSIKVYRFTDGTNYLHAIWGVENFTNYTNAYLMNSEKATFTERTGTYNLPLATGTHINVNNLADEGTEMNSSNAVVSGGTYPVTFGLKPVFIKSVIATANVGKYKRTKGTRIVLKQSY